MIRVIRIFNKSSKQIKREFPNRKDSVKNLMNNDYNKITDDFKTYGRFVNFCITETISVKSKQRRKVLYTFFEKRNQTISKE